MSVLYFQIHLINAVRYEGLNEVQYALQDLQADPDQADQVLCLYLSVVFYSVKRWFSYTIVFRYTN